MDLNDQKDFISELTEGSFFKEYHLANQQFNDIQLHEKEFYKCTFESCDFSKAVLTQCRFENCTFNKCDLSLAKLKGAEFIDVSFTGSKLIGIDWAETLSISGLKFNQCRLDHSVFYSVEMRFTSFEECVLKGADFERANLTKAVFTLSDLEGCKFRETNLTSADFTGAINYSINPNLNKIRKAVFSLPDALALLNCFDIVIK